MVFSGFVGFLEFYGFPSLFDGVPRFFLGFSRVWCFLLPLSNAYKQNVFVLSGKQKSFLEIFFLKNSLTKKKKTF